MRTRLSALGMVKDTAEKRVSCGSAGSSPLNVSLKAATNIKAATTAVSLGVVAVLFTVNSFAALITFTHTGTGSGTIGGTPFANASFTITDLGDTASRQNYANGFFIDDLSASIFIEGLGNFSFTSGTRTFLATNYYGVGFSRAGTLGADLFDGSVNAAFASWDMLSSIGPVTGSGFLLQWSPSSYAPVTTDGGTLIFTSGTCETVFQATIPEPGTALLVGLSFVGLLAISRRKK